MMSILIKYEVDSKVNDMIMYCGEKSTMKDIEERISSIINKTCKVLYVKFWLMGWIKWRDIF